MEPLKSVNVTSRPKFIQIINIAINGAAATSQNFVIVVVVVVLVKFREEDGEFLKITYHYQYFSMICGE